MPTLDIPRIHTQLTPVIGYARVSTWREEMISIDIQKNVVEEAAARRSRYVAEWIIDEDATGRNFKRKVMRGIEIVEDAARPERELWSWKFSRFGRNRHGVAINLARIENVGGELVSATEEVDAKTAVGRFTRGMLLELAAFESDRAGEQWKETHQLRRASGLPATGRKRFGYLWYPRRIPDGDGGWILQEERYEVLPDQAEVTLEGYRQYIAGNTGYAKIAIRWNDLGFRNAWGHPWQDQTVRNYFDSGFAAGLLHVHKPDVRCTASDCRNRDHWDHLPAEHEAIISGDEWDAYSDRRAVRKATPRRSLNPTYPLSGLMECGVCRQDGRKSHAQITSSHGTPGFAYRCGAKVRGHVRHGTVRVRRDVIEDEVYQWLLNVRTEIDGIAAGRIVIPQPRTSPGNEVRRKRLRAEISKLTAGLDRATEGNVMDRIPDDAYERTRDKLTKQRDAKQKELDELPDEEQPRPGPTQHRSTVEGLIREWDTVSVASKRVMLASLIRRVEIDLDKNVTVVPVWAPVDAPLTVDLRTRAR